MSTRLRTPTPGKVTEDMDRVRQLAVRLRALADGVQEGFDELHDAAYWSGGGNGSVTPGGRGGSDSDPTGAAVVSGSQQQLRSNVRQAARALRRLEGPLVQAEIIVRESFARSMDSEMREKIERIEELHRAYEARRKR